MKIVFFDGYCSLCNSLVDWLMGIDSSGQLKFASLQGETARKILGEAGPHVDVDTVIYARDSVILKSSTAVLSILSDVGGIWTLTKVFFLIPAPLRDSIYRLIAKNRYRIWRKRETCRVPTLNERGRLLP